jgi:hypothetical protein
MALNRKASRGDTRYLPAFFGAVAASGGTALAVIFGMRFALAGTDITHVRANAANVLHELRFAAHEGRTKAAHLAAIDAQTRTVRHRLQTGSGTMIARQGAAKTGIQTGLKGLLGHDRLPRGT